MEGIFEINEILTMFTMQSYDEPALKVIVIIFIFFTAFRLCSFHY